MAKTKNGIVYPDNYDKVADVPADLKELAESVDEVIENNKTEMKKSNETRDEKISKNVEDIGIIQETIKSDKESIDKSLENINKKDNEQDEDIKANKESIEELQAENLEIKVENERLRNDIKSIAVVNEVSGENIHIEDSSDARCEIEIGGNHQQDTREGYNLLNNDDLNLSSKTLQTKRKLKIDANTEYSIVSEKEFTDVAVNAFSDDINYEKLILTKEKQNKQYYYKFTTKSDTQTIYFYVVSADEYTNVNDFVNSTKLMLIKGSKATDYEQYGASPSIDYPSPVKSIGDNVNLFPGWEMGTIDVATGNKITDPYYIRSVDFIPILPNIDYTIYSINSFGFDSLNTALRLYDKDKKYLGSQYLGEILEKNLTFKITNLDARFMIPTSTNGQTNVIPKNAKVDIKLEKGIIATPYSSYNCGSAKVDIKNENIFNTENIKSTSEVSVVDNKNGVLELQGVNGFWKGITTTQKFETGKRVYVKCKYVAGTGSAANIGIKDTNGDDILENYKVSNNLISCSFISKGITKIFFRCNGTSDNGNIKYSDIMFSYEDIDYVPNQEQSYLVDVQQPMFEGDTFVKQDGKWYEKHNWKTMSFDGQNMGSQAGGSFADFKENGNIVRVFEIKDLLISSVRNDIFCDKLPRQADSMWNGKSTGIQSWQGQNKILISLPFDDVEKKYGQKLTVDNYVTAFYMYLQDEVLIISYLLAEPKLLECTEAQSKVLDEIYNKAHTYKNITNISAESSEVNPTLNIKYLKDPETEHNKLQAQIDEIKQLLSPTETSAMLLNNMQTDLESEV